MNGFWDLVRTDGRTDARTDGRTDESKFIGPISASGGGPTNEAFSRKVPDWRTDGLTHGWTDGRTELNL